MWLCVRMSVCCVVLVRACVCVEWFVYMWLRVNVNDQSDVSWIYVLICLNFTLKKYNCYYLSLIILIFIYITTFEFICVYISYIVL